MKNQATLVHGLQSILRELEKDCAAHPAECECATCNAVDAVMEALWFVEKPQGQGPKEAGQA